MKKLIKFLGGSLLLLVLVLAFLLYGKVPSNEQLKNVSQPASMADFMDLSKSQFDLNDKGFTTSFEFTSQQFARIVKSSMPEDSEAQEMALSLDGDAVRMELPVQLAFLPSKAVLYGQPKFEGNNFVLQVTKTKLGSLPLPKSIYLTIIENALAKSNTEVKREGDKLIFPFNVSIGEVADIQIQNGKMKVQIQIGPEALSQY